MEAALGVVVHSAWAVVVVLAGPQAAPLLVHRGRIAVVGDHLPAQAYHAAAESGLELNEARQLIERCAAGAEEQARLSLAELIDQARSGGYYPRTCVVVGEERDLPELHVILRSHPLLHTAEGQLARRAVAKAAATLGLHVLHVAAAAAATLGDQAVVRDLGRAAGPPWGSDHKQAVRVALSALPSSVQ